MMNLEQFISETMKQIIDGVSSAQEYARTKDAYINVPIVKTVNTHRMTDESLPAPQVVEFDIAVTTTGANDLQGGMGIFVAGLGIGYQAKKNNAEEGVSRIKFSIPVVLPSQVPINKDSVIDKKNHK